MTVPRPRRFALILLSPLALLAGPALAQDQTQGPPDANDDTLTVAVGAGYAASYEGSDDYVFIPIAAVSGKVSGHNFYTRATTLFFDLIPEGAGNPIDLAFGPTANVRLQRSSRIKDAQVRALGELDTAIEVGAFAGVAKSGVITSAFDNLAFRVSYLRDISDTHDSYIVTPAIEYGTPLSQTVYVGVNVSADYVGDDYATTYFGVSPAGTAASGLPSYTLDGGFKSVSSQLLATVSLSGDLRRGASLFAIGNYSRLLGDFKRSPVVDIAGEADQFFGAVGIAYTF